MAERYFIYDNSNVLKTRSRSPLPISEGSVTKSIQDGGYHARYVSVLDYNIFLKVLGDKRQSRIEKS